MNFQDLLYQLRELKSKFAKVRSFEELQELLEQVEHFESQYKALYKQKQPDPPLKREADTTSKEAQCLTADWEYSRLIEGLDHRSGYVREACLSRLRGECKALPHILLRCNDWVDEIRNAAVKIALEIIPKCNPTDLKDTLEPLQKLERSRRISSDAYRSVSAAICEQISKRTDNVWLTSLTDFDKKFIYNLLMREKSLEIDSFFTLYVHECNPLIKCKLFEYLLSDDSVADELCKEALHSEFAAVRKSAVDHLYSRLHDAWPGVETLLLDPSNKVQEAAAYIVSKHSDISLNEYYSSMLSHDCPSSAIRGLGKYGKKDELLKLARMLDHFTGKRLYFAIHAIADVLQAEAEDIYWKYLEDPSPRVRKEAYKAISKYCNTEPLELYNKYISINNPKTQSLILHILLSHNSWRRFPYTIKMYLLDIPSEHKGLLYNSFCHIDEYGCLTKKEFEFIQQTLDSRKILFSAEDLKYIKFCMKSVTIV